jgi:hypothetical protein
MAATDVMLRSRGLPECDVASLSLVSVKVGIYHVSILAGPPLATRKEPTWSKTSFHNCLKAHPKCPCDLV